MQSAAMLSILNLKDEYVFHFEYTTKSPLLQGQTVHAPFGVLAKKTINPPHHSRLLADINAAAEMLRNLYAGSSQSAQTSPLLATTALRSVGHRLFDMLPASIQQALVNLPEDTPLILRSGDLSLPWELVHDGQQWLALKRPVGWCLLSESLPKQPMSQGTSQEFLVISNPTGDLPEADKEADWLFDEAELGLMYPKLLRRSHASREQVLSALASGQYPIIHYSGHAEPGRLILADGILTAQEIQNTLQGQPFIFLNACSSATGEGFRDAPNMLPYSGSLVGLAQAFILGGASGVVGTLWPVFDVTSREFAQTFYPLVLRNGISVGEALLEARLQMYQAQPADPLWASFVLVGDPTLKIADSVPPKTRHVTVLVAQLVGLLPLFNKLDLDTAVDIQENAVNLLMKVSERYGGQFHAPSRHTLNIHFGVQATHGDEAGLAIDTALNMIDVLHTFSEQWRKYLPVPLTLRVGISTGRVLARHPTMLTSADYQIAGEAIGLANALAQKAKNGQIIVDKATSQSVRKKLTFQALEPLAIVDGLEPMDFFLVANTKVRRLAMTPIVGREDELNDLRQQWDKAKNGRGRVVGIVGIPGVGKTRLVQAFQDQLKGDYQWISASCHIYEKSQPYSLLAQVIGSLAQFTPHDEEAAQQHKLLELLRTMGLGTEAHINEGLALLGRVVGLPFSLPAVDNLDPQIRQMQLARIVTAILNHHRTPIVLALEDLQWVDEASLAVLDQVMNAVGQMRLLLLAIYQPHWSHNWGSLFHYRNMPLDELQLDAQRTLLANLLGYEPPEELIQAILKQTGGNPFFIEEYIWLLQEDGFLIQEGKAWVQARDFSEMPLPDKVERVIQSRLDQLTAESREVTQTAAVIGPKFEEAVLAEIQGKPERQQLNQQLGTLVARRLIRQAGGWPYLFYTFHHGLVHQTVYKLLRERIRRAVHRLVAEVLRRLYDETQIVDRLAHHYYHSNDRVNAIAYGLRAARHAASEWANYTALEWYERVLEKVHSMDEKPPTEAELMNGVTSTQIIGWQVEALEGQAKMQGSIGGNDEAIKSYELALDVVTTSDAFPITRRAELYRKMAIAYHDKGQFEAAQETLDKGLAVLGGLECLEAGRIAVYIGLLHYRRGRLSASLAKCEQGIAIIENMESIRDLAQAYNLQGIIYRNMGESQKALMAHKRSIELYEPAQYLPGQERASFNLGCVYKDLGQWDAARRCFQQSSDLSQRTGEVRRQAAAMNSLGQIYGWQGELDRAIEACSEARQRGEEFDLPEIVAAALINMGASYLKKGSFSEAKRQLTQSLDICQRIETKVYLPEVLRYIAQLHVMDGQPDEALKLAQDALDWALKLERQMEAAQAHRVLGQAYHKFGQLAEAEAQLSTSLTMLEQQDSRYEVGLTLVELARLRKSQLDVEENRDALRAQGTTWCERAIAIFEELGAALDLTRAQEIRLSL